MESVILIRHGQSTANVQKIISSDYEGYPLTEKGIRQTEFLASQMLGARLSGIISSPVLRTRQTSSVISETLGLGYVTDENVRESGLGKYNNFKLTDLPLKSHGDLGMETWESHIERFLSLIEKKSGRYVIVSHAYPIRAILCHYLGLNEHESYGIEVRNATASVVNIEEGRVLCIGSAVLSDRVIDLIRS